MGRRQCDSDEEGTFGRQVAIDSCSRLDFVVQQNHLIGQFQTGSRILVAGQAPLARRRSGEFSNTPRESQSEHCQKTATASRHDLKGVEVDDRRVFQRSINEISHYTDQICDLRNSGRNDESLAATCAQKLKELVGTKHSSGQLSDALSNAQRHGAAHPAHTAAGRLEQALRWLDNPGVDDGGVGMQAIRMLTEDARKLADRLNPQDRLRMTYRGKGE